MNRKDYLKNIKRIVVKIGTSTLTYSNGLLNLSRIENIVRQISNIHNQDIEVVLVSSGAIGAGIGKLGLKSKPKTIPQKQACAAIGQGIIVHMYEKLFNEYGKTAGQILLTRDDMANRGRFLNARNTFFALFEQGVIPIVNENDAVVVDEIKFGDNDTLSAVVASLIEAELLIILSDIDGLYDSNPNENPDAELIDFVKYISPEIKNAAGGAGSNLGTGGMTTKIKAAEIATAASCSLIIANGSKSNVLNDIVDGKKVGTLFSKKSSPMNAKKHWLTYKTNPSGTVVIDNGAVDAVKNNRTSLLPRGIVSVINAFSEGEVITIVDSNGIEIARGITNYNSSDINVIKGLNSYQIEEKLGYKNYDEIIHANNLVVL